MGLFGKGHFLHDETHIETALDVLLEFSLLKINQAPTLVKVPMPGF